MPQSFVSNFNITLLNQSGKLHEGDTLAGEVRFNVIENVVISRLEIKFQGISVVLWQKALEKNATNLSKVSVFSLCDSEQYLNQKLNLLSSDQFGKEGLSLFTPQEYIFPFSIQLPDFLPPTFVGDYGLVKYWARAELLFYPICHPDLIQPLTSSTLLDLSLLEFVNEAEASLTCCWKDFTIEKRVLLTEEDEKPKTIKFNKQQQFIVLKLNDIRCRWQVNKMGFLIGEEMQVRADIENLGRVKILKTKVTLVQHVTYKSQKSSGNIIYQRKKLSSKQKTSISPEECGFWREKITIPPDLPPTNQSESDLINVKYSLKLTIVLQSPFKSMKSEMDIILGTHDKNSVEMERWREGKNERNTTLSSCLKENMAATIDYYNETYFV